MACQRDARRAAPPVDPRSAEARTRGLFDNPAPSYQAAHWGKKAKGRKGLDFGDPRKGPVVGLGELVSVTYGTIKGGDNAMTDYTHTFKAGERPILCYGREGRLFIAGGTYRIEKRGIVG